MKKFVLTTIVLALLLGGGFYLFFFQGFYLPFEKSVVQADFYEKEGLFYSSDSENPIVVKGLLIANFIPDHYSSEMAIEKEDYLRWFAYISEMGANLVRVSNIMNSKFYDALYEFNVENEAPLLLLQGIGVSDRANFGRKDAYDKEFFSHLTKEGQKAVDVIHGRRIIPLSSGSGDGIYRKDVSIWTLGYLVGDEWDPGIVAYTDHTAGNDSEYQGRYFTTSENATHFEVLLSKVMDKMMKYESLKYSSQRMISFACDSAVDFIEYDQATSMILNKYAFVDPEHIVPTEELKSGYFASYKSKELHPQFTEHLSENMPEELLVDLISTSGSENYYQLLRRHHSMPIIGIDISASTARASDKVSSYPMNEDEQGQEILNVYNSLLNCGWQGGIISSWQDSWDRRTWNTVFATDITNNYRWHNIQSVYQNLGIMAFDDGEEHKICYVDGEFSEWSDSKPVYSSNNLNLYATYDLESLYLYLYGIGEPVKDIYIPIHTYDEIGSFTFTDSDNGIKVESDLRINFIIHIAPDRSVTFMVQDRYDASRQNFLEDVTGENPFVLYPAKDSSNFVISRIAVEKPFDFSWGNKISGTTVFNYAFVDTGLLREGNGNPLAEDYDSLADYCYGQKGLEVRIPWALLNVSDPTIMRIHKDYYVNYGVEAKEIKSFYLGASEGNERITLAKINMASLRTQRKYHERLKKSYWAIQSEWKAE